MAEMLLAILTILELNCKRRKLFFEIDKFVSKLCGTSKLK
tara:strand:- start:13 stop:132 length:120 start_codon:yes stop_codon:yes gene_type:complete